VATLIPRDLAFADTAPWRFDFQATIAAAPARVWPAWTDNRGWETWFQRCKACTTTSASAEGVGATRQIKVNGLTADEEFIAWEPERLWAFTVTAIKPSFATSMVERVSFTDLGDRTRIDYRIAVAPRRWAKPLRGIVASQGAKSFAVSFRQFEAYVASR
jgi:uncharacterized protein YndB with AHSA1/START domain